MKIIKPSLTSAAAGILGLALGCIIASRSALKDIIRSKHRLLEHHE